MSDDAAAAEIVIKLAETAEEREKVFRLRYETYVAEMNAFISAADHAAGRLTGTLDERSELLNAYAGGELVGTMRLTFGADGPFSDELRGTYAMDAFFPVVPQEAMLVVTSFIVSKDHRRTALPFDLIAESARIAVRREVELVFCDCQPYLINLYDRLGFRSYHETCTGDTGHTEVVRVIYDPEKIDSSEITVKVHTPDGQDIETTFDLGRLQ